MTLRLPTLFIPHGGGPCFFMADPAQRWSGMAAFLRSLPTLLEVKPAAILLVSAHWETLGFRVTASEKPSLIYDYYGFPTETYALRYDAKGNPPLATEVVHLLRGAGLAAEPEMSRGFDHGVFIPLKVAFPEASIPVVEMSVERELDPALHLAAGRALAPLRDKGVLIIGSGMSYHDLKGFGSGAATRPSDEFDLWLSNAITEPVQRRTELLERWLEAPGARLCHPTAEHLIPLMVAAGASGGAGKKIYGEHVLEASVSGFSFN